MVIINFLVITPFGLSKKFSVKYCDYGSDYGSYHLIAMVTRFCQ